MTYLLLSAFLFAIGLAIVITKKNAILVLMGIELMLNASNLNLIAMSRQHGADGHFMALFVILVAAAEAAVALAIILKVYRHFQTVEPDKINNLKG